MIFNQNIFLRIFAGRAGFFTALLAGVFISCVKIEDNNQGGTGYLAFQSISVDVSVKEDIATKANVPQADLPSESDFIITISGSAIDKDMELRDNEHLSGPILLPAGTYDVSVSYGSNVFGEPYFYYSKKVDIKEDQTESMTMDQVPLANAMVKVELPDLEKHLKNAAITLSHGNDVMNVQKDAYQYVPVKDGVPVIVSLVGTNAVGEQKTFSYSLDVQAKHAYNVVFDLTLPNDFSFKDQSSGAIAGRLYLTTLASGEGLKTSHIRYELSSDGGTTWTQVTPADKNGYWLISDLDDKTSYQIRAVYGGLTTSPWTFTPATPVPVTDFTITHDYKSGVLTGTTVTVSGQDVEYGDVLKSLITERGVQVKNEMTGTIVRTLTGKEIGNLSSTNDWPYLPQGNYTLQSYFKIGEEAVIYDTKSATSSEPNFSVIVSAYTTYDKYLEYKNDTSNKDALNAANAEGKAEYIFQISSQIVGISDDLLQHKNYDVSVEYNCGEFSKELSFVNGSGDLNNAISINNIGDHSDFPWGENSLYATVVFAGSEKTSSERKCYITGLPFYTPDFESTGDRAWTKVSFGGAVDYIKINSSNIVMQFDNGNPKVATPAFYIPGDINVTMNSSYELNGNATSKKKFIIKQYNGAEGVELCSNDNKNKGPFSFEISTTLSSSWNQMVCIFNESGGLFSKYPIITDFDLIYR